MSQFELKNLSREEIITICEAFNYRELEVICLVFPISKGNPNSYSFSLDYVLHLLIKNQDEELFKEFPEFYSNEIQIPECAVKIYYEFFPFPNDLEVKINEVITDLKERLKKLFPGRINQMELFA